MLHQSALPESRLQAGLALLNLSGGLASALLPLATDLLLAAWECNPHDNSLICQLLPLHQQFPFLQPVQERAFRALLHAPDAGLPADDADKTENAHDPRLPVQRWRKGIACFDQGDYAQALRHFEAAEHGWHGITELQGHCLLRLGERDAAFGLWRQVLAKRPWHVQLALSLHDYLQGYDTPAAPTPNDSANPIGNSVVLLYSWNKAPYLHTTLQALEASLPDIRQVICLDNGSPNSGGSGGSGGFGGFGGFGDDTAACLRGWQERWASRLKVIRLPVNVGAPAARNWLAALPEVREAPFAAYVDDDVRLPADWLRHLARAVQLQPHSSAWGCRILDAVSPAATPFPVIQSGPLHLSLNFAPPAGVPPLPGQAHGPEAENAELAFSPFRAHAEPFSVTTMQPDCPDRGQWNYLRPCASVTGCCHLFRSEELQKMPFSLSLSPSQYDDLEHDLRSLREGQLACYTGFCAGLHAKKSGQAAAGLSPAAFGSALGNKYKVHGMFNAEDIHNMGQRECAALEADLLEKLNFIDATRRK